MCGINGIFNFDDSAVCKNELEKMNNEMIYRGPDSDGFYVEKNFLTIYKSKIFITIYYPIF